MSYDILKRENACLGYKDNTLKRSPPFCILIWQKNTNVFWHQSEGRIAPTIAPTICPGSPRMIFVNTKGTIFSLHPTLKI